MNLNAFIHLYKNHHNLVLQHFHYTKNFFGTGYMAQQVKGLVVQALWDEFNPQNPHKERREPTT